MPLSFHIEPPLKFRLNDRRRLKKWITAIIMQAAKQTGEINFIFCTDEYLYTINAEYLKHHTLTDIITFDNSDNANIIEGDIFISIDRVSENAAKYNVTHTEELHRVMAHGVLHLLGYKDKTSEDQHQMRQKENECLQMYEQA